jgi:hypothetical protein
MNVISPRVTTIYRLRHNKTVCPSSWKYIGIFQKNYGTTLFPPGLAMEDAGDDEGQVSS